MICFKPYKTALVQKKGWSFQKVKISDDFKHDSSFLWQMKLLDSEL